jgi:hypothetical protein
MFARDFSRPENQTDFAPGVRSAPPRAGPGTGRDFPPFTRPGWRGQAPCLGSVADPEEREADSLAQAAFGRTAQVSAAPADPVAGRGGAAAESAAAAIERESGAPLPAIHARDFGQRLGFDFSRVRIHRGAEANRAARSIGAEAFTLGNRIALAEPAADLQAPRGAAVLAHELAHVVQNARAEQQAPVLRRTVAGAAIGGVVGGIIGGVGLGLLGSLAGPALGGALGALGALGGAALGAWVGDRISADRRDLTEPEKNAARPIFRASLDLDKVQIQRGSVFSGGNTPRTSGNTINFPDSYFNPGTMVLTPHGALTLIHELVHVWQYQHGGFDYVESSLVPQGVAGSRGLSRNVAYNWRNADDSRLPWERWNAEQQAACIGDFYKAKVRIDADNYPPGSEDQLKDIDTMVRAEPYLAKLQAGVGAPGDKSREPRDG